MANKISKKYEWRGVDALSLSLTIGGKKKDIAFSPGREKPKVNAEYETTDEDIQAAIEACHLFQVGQIRIKYQRAITEVATTAKAAPAKAPNAGATTKGVYTSVTTIQQAADKLIERFGVSADALKTPDEILAKAEELGAQFPNLMY
jgi:hypothetical protein